MKRILLRNTQPLLGDRLMFTSVVRDLKAVCPNLAVGIISAGPEVWENNPHIDPAVNETNAEKIFDIGPAKVTKGSKTNGIHIANAFKVCLEEKMGISIPQRACKPDLYLSDVEKSIRLIDGPYWVINCDTGPFTAKRWPLERFQQVVDSMPDMTFVQVGLAKDCRGRLTGTNVIDLVDKTKIRELFNLVYHADGCISLVSSLMHVAAAFEKPCVVLAGGREPPTFERYAFHRYIDNVGCLPCCKLQACWHNALSACKDHDGKYARCMRLIEAPEVVSAVRSYYRGGLLESPRTLHAAAKLRPLLRIAAKGSMLGGAERSWLQIAKIFLNKNWRVEICPPSPLSVEVARQLPVGVSITNHLSRPCDVLLLYASDMVFGFNESQFEAFGRIEAGRKVMALTYKIGKAGDVPWATGWDKYLFLSTSLCDGFLKKIDKQNNDSSYYAPDTAVLAPCVDLEPFLAVQPKYNGGATNRIMRHSSQGDKKYPQDLAGIMRKCKARFYLMPGPAGYETRENWALCPPQRDPAGVATFLAAGNCFWYLLPEGYTDQGPRVIVEAMAAGLPVIAENRDGAADRVTVETGWLIDSHEQAVDIINSLTPEILEAKGIAARRRAIEHFNPQKWFEQISGE